IAFSPDSTYLLVTSVDGIAQLWDANTYEPVKELFDNYGLFQNIPQPVLVHPSHQKFYPNTCFKDKYEA
ncbi:MAG: hypothetical protein MUC81_14045, partial [Bacteroidia bacterium]|nr:hypothetical protein [Bacteroidia bacterium]